MSRLYVIGVGPGDPELITLKAVRILKDIPVLFVPKGVQDGSSIALGIIRNAVDIEGKEIRELHFPMVKTGDPKKKTELKNHWSSLADEMVDALKKNDAAFITIGDPCFYSTFFYLYKRLIEQLPNLDIEIVPGVSSVNAASAIAKTPLGLANEKIAIIPANYIMDINSVINEFDTIVLIKVHKRLKEIVKQLKEDGLLDKAICISRVGMEGEMLFSDISNIKDGELDYFSMIIIKK